MKALVHKGLGQRAWRTMPTGGRGPERRHRPCRRGHHLRDGPPHPQGDVPTCEPGTILGHEAVGTVEQVGDAVRNVKPGDRVLVSCITACGRCQYCREGRYGQCLGGGGWILGHRIDGVQAERVRVPFADTSTHVPPDKVTNEAALMLADILPTSYEVGVRAGHVQPGRSVVVIAGPIGPPRSSPRSCSAPTR